MDPIRFLVGIFVFAFGACIGSFLNVVIWRLPHTLAGAEVTYKGKSGKLTLSWPPSHCPNCDAAIPWYLNLPIVGWLIIAGRCASCRKPIAVRYPLVELATAILFLATYLAYVIAGLRTGLPVAWTGTAAGGGVAWTSIMNGWPVLGLHLFFIAALLVAAAIDADSYIIPISIPAALTAVAVVSAPFIDSAMIPHLSFDHWKWANPILGAVAGLLAANVLLFLRVLPLSFAMIDADDPAAAKAAGKHTHRDEDAAATGAGNQGEVEKIRPLPLASNTLPIVLVTILSCFAAAAAWAFASKGWAAVVTIAAGTAIFLVGVLSRDADTHDVTDEVMEEISAAGARKEILKEILFLLFPIVGALIGAMIPAGPPQSDWLARLLGVCAGFLAGGGVIWVVRILGTLWKGIEAMGLGDVHLMAGAGAVLGPVLVLVAFPLLSPVLALGWAAARFFTRRHTILPFGPWLAMASILALLMGEPIVAWYMANYLPVSPH